MKFLNGRVVYTEDGNPPDPPTGDGEGGDEPPTGDDPGKNTGDGGGRTFSQAELDAIVKDRLDRQQAKFDSAKQKESEKAEADRLEKEKEFEELANKRKSKVDSLELEKATISEERDSLQGQVDGYEKAIVEQVTALMEKVPDHIKPLLEKLPPLEQWTWLQENGVTASKATASVPSTPSGDDLTKVTKEEEEKIRQASRKRAFRNF